MANAYLINAMYGPRPSTPNGSKVEGSSGDYAHTQDRIPLAERLYGRSSSATVASISQAQDEQQQCCIAKDEADDAEDQPEPWALTGANVLPVGAQSGDTPRFDSLRSMQSPVPTHPRHRLKLPVERYLPPPGPYYDQFSLANVLDMDFSKHSNRCWSCWRPEMECSKRVTCTRLCRVCNTAGHPGLVCPMLYCTLSWFHSRGVDHGNEVTKTESRQVRPTYPELKILKSMGIVRWSTKHDALVLPNMANPVVRQFYRSKEAPNSIKMSISGNTTPKPSIGRESLMRSGTPMLIPAKSEPQATMSLDPRLHGRFAYTTMSVTPPLGLSGISSCTMEESKDQEVGSELEVNGDTETRLQELEDEVLKLKIDNVAKDREIRRLKSENDKLRGGTHEIGSKRARI